jgi:hypothetical protein
VLRNPTLCDVLRQATELEAFSPLAVRLSEHIGRAPSQQWTVTQALQVTGKILYRKDDVVSIDDLAGWTPIRLHWEKGRATLDWCWLGDTRFDDPFFDQTTEKAVRNSIAQFSLRQTSIDVLTQLKAPEPRLTLAGFIFHMSRCGSTLVSRMLAALPQNVVISEAGVIDAVLHAHFRVPGVSDDERGDWLSGLVAALSRPKTICERQLFVKFDSCHVLDLPLIRRIFPTVPWIFVYRHPLEVIASHTRQARGSTGADGASHRARILARYCQSALQHLDDTGRLVEYRQLPAVIWTDVLCHFGVDCSPADIEKMQAVVKFDAKNPSHRFYDDSRTKRKEMSEDTRGAIDRWAMPLYDQLERCRVSKPDDRSRLRPSGAGATAPE